MLFVLSFTWLSQRTPQVSIAKEAAKDLGITYKYFNKIATKIRMAGFIESVRGSGGGYCFVKDAADITLYDIIKVIEGGIIISRCLQEDKFCSRNAAQGCQMRKVFETL